MNIRNLTTINHIGQRRAADKSATIGPLEDITAMGEEIQQLAVEYM